MATLINEATGLLSFVRTVEAGSFTAAARDLKTTPSVVSKAVARLEKHVGARLFLRSTRALQLTPDGQAFFERVAPLLKEINASAEVLQAATEPTGRLRVSLPSEVAHFLMSSIVTGFAKRYPRLHLDVGITDRYVDLVREDYDVVFRVGHMAESDLMIRRLADIDMVLVASPSCIAEWGTPRTILDLGKLPFARYAIAGRPHSILFSNGESIVTHGRIDCDSGHALRVSALEGMGVAHLMRFVVADDLRKGSLIQLLASEPLPSQPFSAIHAFRSTVPTRVRLLCDFIADEAKRFSE
ncbi:LysR family transcriptional regulator [Phyllobacterium sp. P30BS-XVII]|uniref:LysR family transcriptional regulator n=1 Tax=Phyllobacterium sp. P30BS-XVII TaxID=2587046 RepID=UPI000DD7D735|nr:LysR family transcriptional regulator [Phyllobacterium sp. P30BS-XVII]MBA8903924.1 DNA-binding transcriptional LysR family regulator [Phyllobacterium sp. P30BS-XVII]